VIDIGQLKTMKTMPNCQH